MTSVELDIKHWGNNLGVRLPAAIVRAARLRADQRVSVAVEDGRVVVTPMEGVPLTLEQRLARFDPRKHGGEAMVADGRIGAERW
ncbi:MAG: AbrB/MazE/SpoVT family DNA-binding domain-containing protein [Rhodanobacter sp.]|nr:MAG: AbrB/MazE/SpoVT family DNA-binding domain-containing protein [Rhodanobacter sp.]TAM15020.1 MAG: AbrB/MazE/SpoVT family DNA-binding domain-containing protein [Rhodanobacter sp.]TAM36510.1 MAG: AbrB/MazE/SpoVT family DNA-binding domain-containing protein [Rhodanobacter sp.]